MALELAQFRNFQTDDNTPSKTLLYAYSRYQMEREKAAAAKKTNKHR
jgi:hypothetical protein